ncbi:ATP-binding cassette domain-containing protein [Microbacterium schleiferi]|nr:ABC transporter ATP-binding protein [Microbacterium schleiferi]
MTDATDLPDESSGESGETPGEGSAQKSTAPRAPRAPRKTSTSRTSAAKSSGSAGRTPRKPAAKRPASPRTRPATAAKKAAAAAETPADSAEAPAVDTTTPVDPALESALESVKASEIGEATDSAHEAEAVPEAEADTDAPEADTDAADDGSDAPDTAAEATDADEPSDGAEPTDGAESADADEPMDAAEQALATITGATEIVPVDAEPAPALVLRDIRKSFGDLQALDGISLEVPVGSFYGLVGPNGAGKTTTLSIIAGLLRADSGAISIAGVDAAAKPLAAKRLMGVLPDRFRTFDRLTGRQLLYYYGTLRGLPPAEVDRRTTDLARAFDLTESLGRVVSDYSAGMSKKIMLAGALIHSPRVLVLDEPFEAVDPVSSAAILDILQAYVAHGGTVILSSHGMELVERVCSRVAVIVAGALVAEGTVDEVRGEGSLEERFVELVGGAGELEGLEWLHTFSD